MLCVDNDTIVRSYAQAQFVGCPTIRGIGHDLRDPAGLLDYPSLRGLIDLGQPVAIVLGAVLHYIEDDADPWHIVDVLTGAMAPGSYLVMSHAADD